jgi:hypothetical protein
MAEAKHTTGGIPRWSPTLVLVARFSAYVWQSGRDAQFSLTYGRMYLASITIIYIVLSIVSSASWWSGRSRLLVIQLLVSLQLVLIYQLLARLTGYMMAYKS